MFNFLNNFIRKNTGLLIRLDDISANMNWKHMDKCELLFDNNHSIEERILKEQFYS